ncbi:MAG: copper homeostasis protein CutC [Frateuria sp.]|uniref:copper homeostasis protein CutC n=1 Tax=Frateuria sp. TaxID=2211372 RepID=UPI00181039BC|nr:copper homeostasis protein CutC [Frateuria sp.]NUO73935.1 copper homeostasis protein CutC [Frateuria sp.]NUR21628.1 copper homeostasis protein CutC [Frateuria sp.]
MAGAPPLLEVAANSVASALAAQEGGAGRVELCAALELGGVTPSYAEIATARDKLAIPLYVLVRPRGGDFLYNDFECEVMLRDIETCVALGCEGVVLGVLDAQGRVDPARCRPLVAAAGPLGVTFHRAFDMVHDQAQALEAVVALGCERVLTSGAQASAVDGAERIRALLAQAAGRVTIMPGAGVHARNLAALARATGANEFHASAKQQLPSQMRHRQPGLEDMATGEWRSDAAEVRAMVMVLQSLATDAGTRPP